jgi:uncharacterized membrane protein
MTQEPTALVPIGGVLFIIGVSILVGKLILWAFQQGLTFLAVSLIVAGIICLVLELAKDEIEDAS